MWVGDNFEGDENDYIKWMQHDCYMFLLWYFVKSAKYHYESYQYTWVKPECYYLMKDRKDIDHRTLQMSHDLIAAAYRLYFVPKQQVYIENGLNILNMNVELWKKFLYAEIDEITIAEDVSNWILSATGYENTPRGYAAEDKLEEFLGMRYQLKSAGQNILIEKDWHKLRSTNREWIYNYFGCPLPKD